MAEIYTDRLLDHYRNPRRKGRLEPGQGEIREVEEYNPLCGDRVTVALRLLDGQVAAARFEGRGCALCLGAASILCEAVEGQPVEALAALDQAAFLADLQAEPRPARLKCALLPWIAFRRALFGEGEEVDR
ncbi:MAG: iron-sulfur cluster assembly scaffold protein [Anaerolineae bacterium]|nr:iron-sulfur cluster assembly scaffold protein [Anaerolineae bacterium]